MQVLSDIIMALGVFAFTVLNIITFGFRICFGFRYSNFVFSAAWLFASRIGRIFPGLPIEAVGLDQLQRLNRICRHHKPANPAHSISI